jgi:serine/threonine protein kinase
MILANGTRLHNRYLIDALVGQGGMGAVYRATDLHLGHTVAIKENLFPHDPSEDASEGSDPSSQSTGSRRSQFEREAQMLARLKHSGLPKVTDHFVIPDQGQYLVMEFVEGEDLSTRLKRNGPMGERDALNIAGRVCDILSYLHTQKPPIIHRDLKPANIRLTPEGDVVVVDFGVAKLFTSEATVTAARAVTPGFSPLEQYGGTQSTDERSDIYALGATIHQLVVGKRPPEAPMRVTASVAAGQLGLVMPASRRWPQRASDGDAP